MAHFCFACGSELEYDRLRGIQRSACCPKCDEDIRCCKNCTFYDPGTYNECRESQADRITEKEKANFCDFFELADRPKPNASPDSSEKDKALRKLDDLFK